MPPAPSQRTLRIVTVGLLVLALASVIAATWLSNNLSESAPAWQLASTIVGGLVGMLIPPRAHPVDRDAADGSDEPSTPPVEAGEPARP